MRPIRYFTAASLAAFCAPAWALAQVAPTPDVAGSGAATEVETVVVTANRSPTPISQVGQSITVLTGSAIRLDQETDVADILVRTPGLVLDRNGGPGQPTSVFIRGADSDHTVLLIDGVKVNDPSSPGTGVDFSTLLAGDISRIEVLRGAQSTLYGSEAIGGVVNIITADATKPFEGDAQAEGGSYGTAYVKGAIGGKEDRYDWRLGAYYDSTDSVSAFDKVFGGQEDDGFHSSGLSGRFRYDITPDLQFDQRAYYTASRKEFDGEGTPACYTGQPTCMTADDAEFGRTQQLVDYTGLNLSTLDGRLKNRIALEYFQSLTRDEDPNQPLTKETANELGRVTTFEYEGAYALAAGYDLVFGAEDERSTISSDTPYDDIAFGSTPVKADQSLDSGYGQITGKVLPGLTLTGGVRETANSTFGSHVTGQASAAWQVAPATTLRASFGQGFKAPSLFQLYSANGNTSLRPEEANSWDAGIEQHFLDDHIVLQATYFGRDTTNLIEFVGASFFPFGFYQNVNKNRAEGVELEGAFRVDQALTLTANYTFNDDEDRTAAAADLGKQLSRRSKNTANFAATYVWPIKLSTTLAVRYAGRSNDENFNVFPYQQVVLGSYTLVDLRASYPIRDNLELYGRVENLTDKSYETAYSYGTLGRAAYGGVRVKF